RGRVDPDIVDGNQALGSTRLIRVEGERHIAVHLTEIAESHKPVPLRPMLVQIKGVEAVSVVRLFQRFSSGGGLPVGVQTQEWLEYARARRLLEIVGDNCRASNRPRNVERL